MIGVQPTVLSASVEHDPMTTPSSTQRYLIATMMLHWLAPNLSEAPSFRSSHVSLSTWGSRPASLSRSLRRSRLTTLPLRSHYAPTTLPPLRIVALLRSARLTIGWHPSQICLQEGLVRLAKWHRYRHTYRVIRRCDPLAGDLSQRPQLEETMISRW